MAIDLARIITVADRAFRAGTEKFGLAGKGHDLFPGCPMNESADTATEKPGRALQKRPFAASGTR
jgi:hypothetical protein